MLLLLQAMDLRRRAYVRVPGTTLQQIQAPPRPMCVVIQKKGLTRQQQQQRAACSVHPACSVQRASHPISAHKPTCAVLYAVLYAVQAGRRAAPLTVCNTPDALLAHAHAQPCTQTAPQAEGEGRTYSIPVGSHATGVARS